MAQETYQRLKKLIGKSTSDRLAVVKDELEGVGLKPLIYELDSPRGRDTHLVVPFNSNREQELWLTVNYDTFESLPSGNNNGSGVVALLGLAQRLKEVTLPIGVRMIYFDAGLDPVLARTGKRDPEFVPGSELFVKRYLEEQLDLIDRYIGAVAVQAVGKGAFRVFERSGKRLENSSKLNRWIRSYALSRKIDIPLVENSPHADHMAFLKEGLDATVLARYDEKSWHKMQTDKDDMTNVNVTTIDETVDFLHGFLSIFAFKE